MENRDINDRIHESAGEFIAECDHHYRQQAHDAAETARSCTRSSAIVPWKPPQG